MLASNIDELNRIKEEAKAFATKQSMISAVAGGIPVPFQDLAVDILLLKKNLPKISEMFGLSLEQIEVLDDYSRLAAYEVIKEIGAKMVGKFITKELILLTAKKLGIKMAEKQLLKFVPIIGQAISASISFGGMKMILNDHIKECSKVAEGLMVKRLEYKAQGHA